MNCTTQKRAIFFDFDGVLVDSARLKTELFLSFYPEQPAALREEIRAYCDAHGGIPRDRKFNHIHTEILSQPLPEAVLADLCQRFTEHVVGKVIAAHSISGATEFLNRFCGQFKLFVISGTPHEEISSICRRRGIANYFAEIVGAPTTKTEWIRHFLQKYHLPLESTVMVGDSLTDYHAALETGVDFIGIEQPDRPILPAGSRILPDLRGLPTALQNLYPEIEPLLTL